MSNKDIKISLTHPNEPEIILDFEPLTANKGEWLKHVVLLPWTTPTRLVGFVHPAAEKDIDVAPFTLFAAMSYYASVGMQPLEGNNNKIRIVEGPKAVLPVDLIAPADIRIGSRVPSWMFLRDQSEDWVNIMKAMFMKTLVVSEIEAPPPGMIIKP